MKKLIKLFIIFLLIICFIGFTTPSTNNKTTDSNEELINSIVNLALEDAEIKIDDYVDVNYFSNLKQSSSIVTSHIQKLVSNYENDEINDEDIDELQYNTLTESISNVFYDLSKEEYDVFTTLAEEDSDIANMLDLIESNFNFENNNNDTKTSTISTLVSGVATISTILSAQHVCSAAIVTIKGAFNSMVTTLKAFFVPNTLKSVIVTASILIISTVVIINWNKIKPVFNKIVDVFVNNAKKLATTVTKVFNSIHVMASEEESTKDVADDATSQNQMQKQVEKGQAPKEVDRVDKAHTKYGQEHVHFKDGTAINKDGTVHDDGHGTPKLSNKVLDWLNKNGWCLNELKN